MFKATVTAFTIAMTFAGVASAADIRMAKASSNPAKVYQKAQKACGGNFSIIDSWSNAGGMLADLMPGPFTWYGIAYACGGDGGIKATFPFRGQQFDPAMLALALNAASNTSNASTSKSTHCTVSSNGASSGVVGHISCH